MTPLTILFALLCVDDAAGFHGDFSFDAAAAVAIVLGVIAVLLELRGRVP